MTTYGFNITFTRPDENNATVYSCGFNAYGTGVDSPEAAEAQVRRHNAHLTLLTVELAVVLTEDGDVIWKAGAKPVIHLTLTGPDAGAPFCGCDKAARRAAGDSFAHVPYTNADAFLARPEICAACKAEWDAAAE